MRRIKLFSLVSSLLIVATLLRAADEINEVSSASGLWKWSFTMPDGSDKK